MREYHVSKGGSDFGTGLKDSPFQTISKAASIAVAGDTIIVHEGTYREWVSPANSGMNHTKRIVYMAAPGEKVIIKGSEEVSNWIKNADGVWKTVVPNTIFGEFNPFARTLRGDWFNVPTDRVLHLGNVYLNGKALYEAASYEQVVESKPKIKGVNPEWPYHGIPPIGIDDSIYQWYGEVGKESTTIWANFQQENPNLELTEISVRECCFYPKDALRNYITVRGFEMAQAACPWAPPTADQVGLLGTHWSKGWIIEENIIHDAKCSGISLGKDGRTGNMLYDQGHRKTSHQYQLEAVFLALQQGWSKELVGSHVVRNNTIYDCGQNAIVGHMGCVFSEIYQNHIYNISMRQEFFGCEIAGIKLHAAIDVQIRNNNIHHCGFGTWLDWQAQGARISGNLYYENGIDLMIEVSHGPHIVDNNIFASECNLENFSQGGAYLHNLFCGCMRCADDLNRATPYHFPHTTQVAGAVVVYGGDDRWVQNIFVGKEKACYENGSFGFGTFMYNGSTVSLEEYVEQIDNPEYDEKGAVKNTNVKQPVYIKDNIYFSGSKPFEREEDPCVLEAGCGIKIEMDKDCSTWMQLKVPKELIRRKTRLYCTTDFEAPRITEAAFEHPDGSEIIWNHDYHGNIRSKCPVPGPFEDIHEGENRILLWPGKLYHE